MNPGVTRLHPLIIVLVAAVIGCSTASPIRPNVAVPDSFSGTGEATLPDRWWIAIDDPELAQLIDVALADNPGLLATWQRLAQAKATARRVGASSLPSLSADASAGVSVSGDGASASGSSSVSLGLAASYEVDLWGSIGASRDAAGHDVNASTASLQAAAITLTAEVASTWYELIGERRQAALLTRQLDTALETLEMVAIRFDAGAIPQTDVLRQRQQVESLRGSQSISAASVQVLEHSLAILLGKPPGYAIPETDELPALPAVPATGVPGALVQRRPDILESYYRVLAADRRVAEAIADRFPRLSLSARVSTSATSPQNLFTDWLASLVGNLVQPLLDGGARKAEVVRTRAVLLERIQLYRAQVLAALGEVEDALARESRQVELVASLDKQIELSHATYELTQEAYRAGAADYLRVLDAEESLQTLERSRIAAEHDRVAYRISLYRALAGGWEMDSSQS